MKKVYLKRSHKAFTLIELLVVIAIIGILASVVVVNVGSSRIKARDAKRIAGKNEVITALKMAADDNGGIYPTGSVPGWYCIAPTGEGCWFSGSAAGYQSNDVLNGALSKYLTTYPTTDGDPGKFAYNRYLYDGNFGSTFDYRDSEGYGGVIEQGAAYLIWPFESDANKQLCTGKSFWMMHKGSGGYDPKYKYCYEYLGKNQ